MKSVSTPERPVREVGLPTVAAQDALDVTVVVAILTPDAEIDSVVFAFGAELDSLAKSWECVLVFDGVRGAAWEKGQALVQRFGARIKTVAFEKSFGESVCLSAASEIALGRVIVTSPPYVQIDPVELAKMLATLDAGADMAVPWRRRRVDPWLNRFQSATFNLLMRKINGGEFHDLNCYFRAFKREVLSDITVYGDMYRFLPLIALRQGFRVVEVPVRHLKEWGKSGFFGIGVYIRRFLDVVGVVFLTRFTLKPLRFFGSIGLALTLVGGVMLTYMVVERLLVDNATLNNRPAFLLALMLFSLGVQVVGFGLVGEIIIYTQARNLREYRIERRWDDDAPE